MNNQETISNEQIQQDYIELVKQADEPIKELAHEIGLSMSDVQKYV